MSSHSVPEKSQIGEYREASHEAVRCLRQQDWVGAAEIYQKLLFGSYLPFLTISEIAEVIYKNPKEFNSFAHLDGVVIELLGSIGRHSSVYHLSRIASILNRKIMKGRAACGRFQAFSDSITHNPNIKGRPRIALLTCVWGRPELTSIVLSYYQKVQKVLCSELDLVLVAVGSEGSISRSICERYGFAYHEYANYPLSEKWNFALGQMREYDLDGLVIAGSDDLLCVNLFRHYKKLFLENIFSWGLKDALFLDLSENPSLIHWHGYGGSSIQNGMPKRLNEAIGMGRFYSRHLLEIVEFSLWEGPGINRGLDERAKKKLTHAGLLPILHEQSRPIEPNGVVPLPGQVCQPMNEIEVVAVDIKLKEQNITSFDRYTRCPNGYALVRDPWQTLKRSFPPDTVDELRGLSRALPS